MAPLYALRHPHPDRGRRVGNHHPQRQRRGGRQRKLCLHRGRCAAHSCHRRTRRAACRFLRLGRKVAFQTRTPRLAPHHVRQPPQCKGGLQPHEPVCTAGVEQLCQPPHRPLATYRHLLRPPGERPLHSRRLRQPALADALQRGRMVQGDAPPGGICRRHGTPQHRTPLDRKARGCQRMELRP